MSAVPPAEEIADDFRHSLEFLQSPDKYAINNFTVIAKENTEHADAISNVLVEHISKAPPHHKLPALYVLDSIAKNIGTPYTLFLGHKLYNVFLVAYSAVDQNTRRKLDEMLKTWKSPVPGSIDPTPVFALEFTRKIDNALAKWRGSAMRQREQGQGQAFLQNRPSSALGGPLWTSTPTPPQQALPFTPPPQAMGHQQQPLPMMTHPLPMPVHANTQGVPTTYVSHYPASAPSQPYSSYPPVLHQQYQTPGATTQFGLPGQTQFSSQGAPSFQIPDMNVLHRDIDQLILSCGRNIQSGSIDPRSMSKLEALRALKLALNTQNLPPEQLKDVRRQVDELQANEQTHSNGWQQRPTPTATPSIPAGAMYGQIPSQNAAAQVTPFVPSSGRSESTPVNLAELLAQARGTPSTNSSNPINSLPEATGSSSMLSNSSPGISSMLASLADSGLFNRLSKPETTKVPTEPQQPVPTTSIVDLLARATGNKSLNPDETLQLSSASLKIPRPSLYQRMLERRSNQCANCGLRFEASDEGKAKKEKHMDWHFRANQRIADASRGIQSRSWFVGELEWIRFQDSSMQMDSTGEESSGVAADKNHGVTPGNSYVSVPSDPESHQPCPICQERFDTGFNQDIQDWVWLDAIKINSKIYHATCFSDIRKDGQDIRDKTATPDSILGKRKAESNSTDVSPMKKITAGN